MLWVAAAVRVQVVRPVGVPLALLLAAISQRAETAGGSVRGLSLDRSVVYLGEAEVIVEQLAANIEQDLRSRRQEQDLRSRRDCHCCTPLSIHVESPTHDREGYSRMTESRRRLAGRGGRGTRGRGAAGRSGCCGRCDRCPPGSSSGSSPGAAAGLAVGETVTLLHPPLPLVGVINWDVEGASAK